MNQIFRLHKAVEFRAGNVDVDTFGIFDVKQRS